MGICQGALRAGGCHCLVPPLSSCTARAGLRPLGMGFRGPVSRCTCVWPGVCRSLAGPASASCFILLGLGRPSHTKVGPPQQRLAASFQSLWHQLPAQGSSHPVTVAGG